MNPDQVVDAIEAAVPHSKIHRVEPSVAFRSGDVYRIEIVLTDEVCKLLQNLYRLEMIKVHFPVTTNQWTSGII